MSWKNSTSIVVLVAALIVTPGNIVAQFNMDLGDAPASYGTLLTDDGPRHLQAANSYQVLLGSTIDYETDGQPGADALGDDNDATDDEDGVNLVTATFIAGSTNNLEIFVSIAPDAIGSFINAWVDFNANGSFETGEHVIAGVTAKDGGNLFPIAVPLDAEVGQTYLRVRVSSMKTLGPGGEALDGEVEDYRVTVQTATEVDPATWGRMKNLYR